jgi:hypothetical protein
VPGSQAKRDTQEKGWQCPAHLRDGINGKTTGLGFQEATDDFITAAATNGGVLADSISLRSVHLHK